VFNVLEQAGLSAPDSGALRGNLRNDLGYL
jgi:hypothetical protein